MFKLELDLHLYFDPPMADHGDGIAVTRTIDVPFPPWSGLLVYGRELDECPSPGGWPLKDVTWDVDRGVFLATTSLHSGGVPMAMIPDVVRAYVDRGWRLGSYMDLYEEPNEDESPEDDDAVEGGSVDEDEMELWPTMPARGGRRSSIG